MAAEADRRGSQDDSDGESDFAQFGHGAGVSGPQGCGRSVRKAVCKKLPAHRCRTGQ